MYMYMLQVVLWEMQCMIMLHQMHIDEIFAVIQADSASFAQKAMGI